MSLHAARRIEGTGMKAAWPQSSSWPGLSRPSTSLLRDCVEEIVPIWVHHHDLSNLPRAWPMLDVVFALNGIPDIFELLKVDQPLQPISLGKPVDESGTMFEYSADKIARHSNVEDAVRAIGQKIDVSTCHAAILQDVDGRDKPGHDELRDLALPSSASRPTSRPRCRSAQSAC